MYCDRVSFVLLGFDGVNSRNTESFTNNIENFRDIHLCQEYSLDCKEGHMKKNRLCVCVFVCIWGQKNIGFRNS